MNIDRLNPGTSLPRTAPTRRGLDLTISDLGVSRRQKLSLPAPAAGPTADQVTSTPGLQALLSPEETRALKESFVSPSTLGERSQVYTVQGKVSAPRSALKLGALVDIEG